MLKIHVERFGPPSVIAQCVKSRVEPPSAWEALVKIDAFPVNPADLAMLSGRYGVLPNLPSGIGMEAAGRIEKLGDSITDFEVGDRVMVVANNNWAQYRSVPANLLYKVPDDFDPIVTCMMKVNPATAYMLLTRFVDLKKGSWIIQNAPLSNVGRLVIQFEQQLNLKTVNLVRRPDAVNEVESLGGDIAVNSEDEDFLDQIGKKLGRAKVKLALDAVGGKSTNDLASVCADNASIVTYGMLSGEPCVLNAERIVFNRMEHKGFWLSKILNRISHSERVELFDTVVQLFQERMPRPKVDALFSIDQIAEALRYSEKGEGKAVVLPNGIPEGSVIANELQVTGEAK